MKYLIVGGVAGGASTAARLRRLDEHAEIIIFERGAYISYANCGLPYYAGGIIEDRNKLLVQTVASFRARFNIDVRVCNTVLSIDRHAKSVSVLSQPDGNIYQENYDKLILSPGAAPLRPDIPGAADTAVFTLRSVDDADLIKAFITDRKPGRAVVVGAGYIGLEMAENLAHAGLQVVVIERASQVLPTLDVPVAAQVHKHLVSKGIEVLLNADLTEITRSSEGEISLFVNGGQCVRCDIVVMAVGVRAESVLAAEAGLDTGLSGGILVNEFLQSSDPDIYALGDAIEFVNPINNRQQPTYLAGPASKQGRICADNIVYGNRQRYEGAVNSAIVKIFDMAVGIVGMSGAQLSQSGLSHLVSTVHGNSHSTYYPDSKRLTIQIAFSPIDGRLLGAQVAGFGGVDKRLDVLGAVIKRGGNVRDLLAFEQAYAPPFSSARDLLNVSGAVADNILRGLMVPWYYSEDIGNTDSFLIDVRQAGEYEEGHMPGAVNIPLPELRDRLAELPGYRELLVYCQVGLRGYVAQRILLQHGFKCRNLSGGYLTWSSVQR